MKTDATAPLNRSWVERNLSALMVGIFGTAISALLVVMTMSIKDLRSDLVAIDTSLATIDTSLTTLQTETISAREAIANEVALIDDEIINSIGDLRSDFAIANQHLTGIDTHLSLIKRDFSPSPDFSLGNEIELVDDEIEPESRIENADHDK